MGFPAIDLIAAGRFASAEEVRDRLHLDLSRPVVLFTQHSITTEIDEATAQTGPSLEAMLHLASEGVQVILTYPNNDAGGRHIIALLEDVKTAAPPGVQVHRSLGRSLYHGVLALARDPLHRVACVGNSSSGIKETPAFGCPTVNIGSRQQGRLRAANVLDADYDAGSITVAVRRCLEDEAFRTLCREVENPYGVGDAGVKIANRLATIPYDPATLLRKGMTLRGECRDGWYR